MIKAFANSRRRALASLPAFQAADRRSARRDGQRFLIIRIPAFSWVLFFLYATRNRCHFINIQAF